MSWLGAGIGAGIGFAIGGPIGAGIGMWLGSSISRNKKASKQQQNQTVFFVSLFSILAKMAKADGVVDKDEIKAIEDFMQSINLDSEDRKAAINIFKGALNNQYSIYEYADQYRNIANNEMREMLYATLWRVAYADGKIHPNEDKILKEILKNLGINDNLYYQYSQQKTSSNSIDKHYAVLGCTKDSSDAEVKKLYRKAMSEYHPDKIQSQGLPKEFIKLANEKSKQINEAYSAIKKARKM